MTPGEAMHVSIVLHYLLVLKDHPELHTHETERLMARASATFLANRSARILTGPDVLGIRPPHPVTAEKVKEWWPE